MTALVRGELKSYRELPLLLYQIQTKFRDELRPRGGLLRTREFVMKDGYSFSADVDSLDQVFDVVARSYDRIHARCGVDAVMTEGLSGAMGGWGAMEFMALCPDGEDRLFLCDTCGYAANDDCCECVAAPHVEPDEDWGECVKVETPGRRTVGEVCEFLDVEPARLVKTLLFWGDGCYYAALVRGDREVREAKLQAALGVAEMRMADDEEVERLSGAPVGYAGPVGLPADITIVADSEVRGMTGCVVGGNEADAHLASVAVGRDFTVQQYADLREATHGDKCPRCEEGYLRTARGIETANIFKLGTKYSEAFHATFAGPEGGEHPLVMGCYGLGVSRLIAAIAETHHDDAGLIWPLTVAPFETVILLLDPDSASLTAAADGLHGALCATGHDCLLDDRPLRPGAKFKDADLVGYPVQVVVGKRTAEEGRIEVRTRRGDIALTPTVAEGDEAVAEVCRVLRAELEAGTP
jgi:prolyl-tRNA synthetase